jgi:adenylate cyclase
MAAGAPSGANLAATVSRRLWWAAVLANGTGAVDIFLFLSFLLPISGQPDDFGSVVVRNGIAGTFYLVFTLWIGSRLSLRAYAPIERWLAEERPATAAERDAVLRHPFVTSRISAVMWSGAAVVFVLFNLWALPADVLALTFVTLVLAGMTTAAVAYLISERLLRPITARALAGGAPERPVAPGVTARLLTAWTVATGIPILGVVAVAITQLARGGENATEAAAAALFLAVLGLGVGLLAIFIAARSVADPVASVRRGLARVEAGDYSTRVEVDDSSEVGLLEAGFNQMAAGLEERERLRDLFGRHVGEEVARAALEQEVRLGGEEREVAALFVDIVGSTTLAARRPATEVVEMLNRFFRAVVETVEARGGFVNKFEGDAALCVFGAPVERPNPAADALVAARALQARLRADVPEIDFGIGVSAGLAVAGNVGAEQRFEYTVIGDPVNEAARLCDLAKQHPERLLASEAAVRRAGPAEASRWEIGEPTVLRGRDEATRLATVA